MTWLINKGKKSCLWDEKRSNMNVLKGRLKWIQSLFCMVFFGGLTVTSHHSLFRNVFKVDFVFTVFDNICKWVKKKYLRKKILQAR